MGYFIILKRWLLKMISVNGWIIFFHDLVPGVASLGTVISGGLERDQGPVSLSQMTSFYISSHFLQNFGQKQISFVRKRRKKILLIPRRGES